MKCSCIIELYIKRGERNYQVKYLCGKISGDEEEISKKEWHILNFIMLFCSLVLYLIFYKLLIWILEINEEYTVCWIYFVIIYILYIVISSLIKYRAIKSCINDECTKTNKVKWKAMYCENIVFSILSPDFYISDSAKRSHLLANRSGELKGEILKKFNSFNFMFSVILLIISMLLLISIPRLQFVIAIPLTFLILRIISRSLEICFAFYIDVTSQEVKNTDLKKTDRLTLAVISYSELILSYATIYMLLNNINARYMNMKGVFYQLFDNILLSIGNITLSDSSLSYIYKDGILIELDNIKYLMALQIISGLVLTVFAVASYLGKVDSKN